LRFYYTGCGGDEGDCTEEYLREVAKLFMGLRRVDKHVVFWWLSGADRHWQLSSLFIDIEELTSTLESCCQYLLFW